LNIFEPRYLNMVEDTLKTHPMFGMVQPDPSQNGTPSTLFCIGCAGRITSYKETHDGRIILTLTGLIRFRCAEELDSVRGYRIIVPDWSPFRADLDNGPYARISNRAALLTALWRFFGEKPLEGEWHTIGKMPDALLVNTMATILPLEAMKKQALLEAQGIQERADMLRAAIIMAAGASDSTLRH
jgi:Lon protease-like protein